MVSQIYTNQSPFELPMPLRGGVSQAVFGLIKSPLERILRLRKLDTMYRYAYDGQIGVPFADRALQLLNIGYNISREDMDRIPKTGPVIVTANHPYGAIEGIIMASLFGTIRPDFKILANYLLTRIKELQPLLIAVNPFDNKNATYQNLGPVRSAIKYVSNGGMLGIFPAGEVSHLRLGRRTVVDPEWNSSIARLIRRTNATVVPMYFDGANSLLFHLAGLLHPVLRTVLLPNELLNKCNTQIPVRIGNPISKKTIDKIDTDREAAEYIRMRTYLLSERSDSGARHLSRKAEDFGESRNTRPVASPDPREYLQNEIDRLIRTNLLIREKDYSILYGTMSDMPFLLREIGRLREITFREVGEGTGKSIDLDKFDAFYTHVFAWDHKYNEVVGAYRLGATDTIMEAYGLKGFYTHTLFNYSKKLIEQIGPALELGRSFIRAEYQKQYAPLNLLWVGIGHYIAERPQYKNLFGPVSINSSFQSISQQMMVNFLKANNYASDLARLVKPRTPMKDIAIRKWDDKMVSHIIQDIGEVSTLIGEVEQVHKGVPVLLRHYLRLGGKLLGFNIDPDFGDVLDGLILVDLRQTGRRLLNRYLGEDGADHFRSYHGIE